MRPTTTICAGGRRLRTRDAAAHLGLSTRYLEKLRAEGGGPRFAAMGRVITYAVADLEAWSAARTVENTAQARALPRLARSAGP